MTKATSLSRHHRRRWFPDLTSLWRDLFEAEAPPYNRILAGRQPEKLTVRALMGAFPVEWAEQRRMLSLGE